MAPTPQSQHDQVASSHPVYDRILDDRHLHPSPTMAANPGAAAAAVDMQEPQVGLAGKMLSATVGSLLTSLTGTHLSLFCH